LRAQQECHEGGFCADCAASFLRGEDGPRPVFGDSPIEQEDPHFCDNLLFYEFFHGDTGHGLGTSHQTGWAPQPGN
jgi:hypothetical protein